MFVSKDPSYYEPTLVLMPGLTIIKKIGVAKDLRM